MTKMGDIITISDYDKLPEWFFEMSAVREIHSFIRSLSDEEWKDLVLAIKVPQKVRVRFPIKIQDEHGTVLGQNIQGAFISRGEDYDVGLPEHYSALTDKQREDISNMISSCVLTRCIFRDRYVEKLTKHQERLIRRGGSIAPDDRRIITIYWDAPTPTYMGALDALTQPPVPHTSRHVCEHEVRGHPRHLRSGRVVWVSAHRRGDPDVPRKTITRIIGHETHSDS